MPGSIRIAMGGWTFEPWRGVFHPAGRAHKHELAFASRALVRDPSAAQGLIEKLG